MSTTSYAMDEHERPDLPWPLEADHWFWSAGNQWLAVVADWHEDWWEGSDPETIAARPTPWQLPIAQMPESGILVYRDSTGREHYTTVDGAEL